MAKVLTKREKEVFELLILNKSTKDIAKELNISEKTIRNHISNAMQKLGVKGRAGAVVELLKLKEIPKPDDTADALAIAVCHAHANRLEKTLKNFK